jgi:hypothetical protein
LANSIQGNKILIDSTGLLTDSRVKIVYVLFTPDAANDELILRETASGSNCFYIRGSTAKNTVMYDFSATPLVFNNGVYVQTLTANAKVVLVTVQGS